MAREVRIRAKDEAMAKVLKHPTAGGFKADWQKPVAWPRDAFTMRRIRDGDVVEAEAEAKQAESSRRTKRQSEE